MDSVGQDLADSNKKIQALKSQDTVSQLKTALESIESLTIERDEVKKRLNLSQVSEQKAKQQLADEKTRGTAGHEADLERLKREAEENEELWKEQLMEAEKVYKCLTQLSSNEVYFILENSCCP